MPVKLSNTIEFNSEVNILRLFRKSIYLFILFKCIKCLPQNFIYYNLDLYNWIYQT